MQPAVATGHVTDSDIPGIPLLCQFALGQLAPTSRDWSFNE